MFCGQCGEKIADNCKFCTNCGAPVTGSVSSDGNERSGSRSGLKKEQADQSKKITNNNIIMLILSAVSFILLIAVPYVSVFIDDQRYPVWIVGRNELTVVSDNEFEAEFIIIFLAFLAVQLVISCSVILKKSKRCLIGSVVYLILSLIGFSAVMENLLIKNSVVGFPIGCFIQIGLSIFMLVMSYKEHKKIRQRSLNLI